MTLFRTTRATDGANAPMANATTLAIASDHRLIILLRDIERTSRDAEGVEVEDYTRGLELLIASTNPGKVREIRAVLAGLSVTLYSLADLPAVPEPLETGRTFADNALLKARYYARSSQLLTVAEDSGLVIDALDGRPGVNSARYPGATYPEKFARLYGELAPHPRPWTARFVCSLAFVGTPDSVSAMRRHSSRARQRSRERSRRSQWVRSDSGTTPSSTTRRTRRRSGTSTTNGNWRSRIAARRFGNSGSG